jgi:hypothetical protein
VHEYERIPNNHEEMADYERASNYAQELGISEKFK